MIVQEVIRELRKRVERESNLQVGVNGNARLMVEELDVLRSSCLRSASLSESVGRMRPSPHTRRAQVGAFLIRIFQRALFWYTPAIVRFQNEVVHALGSGLTLFEMQQRQILAQQHELKVLRGELRRLQNETRQPFPVPERNGNGHSSNGHTEDLLSGTQNELLDSFIFASYDSLRGKEEETAGKLEAHLDALRTFDIPEGLWLDIGCGRGEWMNAVSIAGYDCRGIDTNTSAIGYCREMGLHAIEADALKYLRNTPSESLAVVSLFQFVDHIGIAELLAIMREVARVLKPGGLVSIETPDPANLLTASHQFWRDPSHRQPVPMSLMELVYDYFDLTVVKRLHLNRPPESDRLPFDELEPVRRLNEHLYGPQDYGLIGRR